MEPYCGTITEPGLPVAWRAEEAPWTISKLSSEYWLLIGHKKCFVLLCPMGEQHLLMFFLWVRTSRLLTRSRLVWLTWSMQAWMPVVSSSLYIRKSVFSFRVDSILKWRVYIKLKVSWLRAFLWYAWKGNHIFSVSIMIIPTRLLCSMQANSSGAEFLSTISKFIKRKKIFCHLMLVYVLHKTWS